MSAGSILSGEPTEIMSADILSSNLSSDLDEPTDHDIQAACAMFDDRAAVVGGF